MTLPIYRVRSSHRRSDPHSELLERKKNKTYASAVGPYFKAHISIWLGSQALKPSRQAVPTLTRGQDAALLLLCDLEDA